jgi:hypothetical protein
MTTFPEIGTVSNGSNRAERNLTMFIAIKSDSIAMQNMTVHKTSSCLFLFTLA